MSALYTFGDLDRRGKFFGLHLPQFLLSWAVLFCLIPLIKAATWPGRAWWVAVMAVLAWAAFGRVMDRGLWEWAPVLAGWWLQKAMGETVLRGGPRADLAGQGNPVLNGVAATLRWLRLPDGRGGGVAVVFHPKERSYSATLRVRAGAFSLLDSGTQQARVDGWGRLLASLTTHQSRLARLAVMERTVPDSGDAVQRHFDHAVERAADRPGEAPLPSAVAAYQQLIDELAPQAQRHESYLTVTMSAKKAAKDIKRAGGGADGALAVLFGELRGFESAVRRTGLVSEGWLTPRELAAVVRTQYDPASIDTVDQRGRGQHAARIGGRPVQMPAGVDPAAAGPIFGKAANDYYQTDSAWHRVFWVSGLPKVGVEAAFCAPLVLESTFRRTMTLIVEPVPTRAAEAALNRRQLREAGDQALRDRIGKQTTMRDQLAGDETERKLDELLRGHGFLRTVLLVTVSADDPEGLEEATGELTTLANLSRLELRILYAQQPGAFAAAALPLGLGVGA